MSYFDVIWGSGKMFDRKKVRTSKKSNSNFLPHPNLSFPIQASLLFLASHCSIICKYHPPDQQSLSNDPVQCPIKSVSWSGHSFVGLTETDQLVTYVHESKNLKLKVADMEIWKNNKLDMFIYLTEYFSMPNSCIFLKVYQKGYLINVLPSSVPAPYLLD